MNAQVSIKWSAMSGLGPKAWERDEKQLTVYHSHHPHPKQQYQTRPRVSSPQLTAK